MGVNRDRIVTIFAALMIEAHGKNAIAVAEKRLSAAEDNEYVAETWSRVVKHLRRLALGFDDLPFGNERHHRNGK